MHSLHEPRLAKAEIKQYTEAIADYDKALELDPNFAPAYTNRGNAKADLKEYTEAIDQSHRTRPKLCTSLHNRGNAKYELKQYTEAIADYDKAIELDPNLHQPTQPRPRKSSTQTI